MVHPWEEPFLSGTRGSGAVFFVGCNLRCVFCQNHPVSQEGKGRWLDREAFGSELDGLLAQGVHNLNLVTPTPWIDFLERFLSDRPVPVPVVWNSNGYDGPDRIRRAASFVSIHLPDVKCLDPGLSRALLGRADYAERMESTLSAMMHLYGPAVVEPDGLVRRGVAIRHLVLPGLLEETYRVLEFLAERVPLETPLSLMSQYTPFHKTVGGWAGPGDLTRRLTRLERRRAHEKALDLGFRNLWIQGADSASARYTPSFEGDGDGLPDS